MAFNPPPVQSPVDQVAQPNGPTRAPDDDKKPPRTRLSLSSVWIQWFGALYTFLTTPQAWSDKTSARALGGVYPNSGAKDIQLDVTVTFSAGGQTLTATIGGVAMDHVLGANETSKTIFPSVPPGASCSITGSGTPTLQKWYEKS